MVGPVRHEFHARNRVTLGKMLPSAYRTRSMRLNVGAFPLLYPQPLLDIEPDASKTSMASSVQGGRSSAMTGSTWQVTATAEAIATNQMQRDSEATIALREDR